MSYEHPSVYIATYSNIDVYECSVGESPIMRRCKDDWVNATQILKLCNFPKAKRTKILEKGVQQGLHEKVQGGYGRFQGTWIPLEEARKLAKEYNISADLVPVLYVDLNDPSVIIPKKSKLAVSTKNGTPVKRKYVKKVSKDADTPKKMKFDDNLPPSALFTPDYNSGMHAGNPAAMGRVSNRMSIPQYSISGQHMSMPSGPSSYSQMDFMPNGAMSSQNVAFQRPGFSNYSVHEGNFQPQRHLMQGPGIYGKASFSNGFDDVPQQQIMYQQRHKGASSQSTNETNWSQEDHARDSDTSLSSSDPKLANVSLEDDNSHASQLLRFFSEDNAPIPYFLYNPPPDFNINEAIDDEGHSTLHWAASIGNLNLVQLVLSKGANPLVVSNFGLNPLSKCISFNNCFDLKNFPHILDALEMCLINTDINGRTPLHYLCQFSKVRSKLPAISYYIDVTFKKLSVMSENNSGSGVNLMKNVINHQDVNGDTCLHLAARAGCSQLIKFFLGHGARDDLLDVNNQTAKAIIMQLDLDLYGFQAHNMDKHFETQAQEAYTNYGHNIQQGDNLQSDEMRGAVFRVPKSSESEPLPTTKRHSNHGLDTPVRSFNRTNETPDTQRTTIQDEEEEMDDRVSKEHLKDLLEKQAGTVDENKENIFMDEPLKSSFESMSTPKHRTATNQSTKPNVLGVISEKTNEDSAIEGKTHLPNPPQLDEGGKILERSYDGDDDSDPVKLPMKDVSSMMHGMVNSLSNSYEDELKDLKMEYQRIQRDLKDKEGQDSESLQKAKALMERNGFKKVDTLEEAAQEIENEIFKIELELKNKELQLSGSFEKYQASVLTELLDSNLADIEVRKDNCNDSQERWEMSVELSKVQLKRNELVAKVCSRIRDFAITPKMTKYRKLISLSCGLRVEDIDSVIDGIADSLQGETA